MRTALMLVLLSLSAPAAAGPYARLAPPGRGVQVRLSPFTIPAHSEREVCQLVEVPSRRPLDIAAMEVAMASGAAYGSHHFAIFLYHGDDADRLPKEPFDSVGCAGVGDELVSPILAFMQRPRQRIRFPTHVGVRLAPQQRLLLNSHYLNAGPTPVTVAVAVNFRARRAIRHHVRSFQLGTMNIDVPPGQSGSAEASWTAPFPMNVVWLTSHSHKYTASVVIDLLRGGVEAGQQLETVSYAGPSIRRYRPPLRLEPGDAFRWTCNYVNPTDRRLTFGVTSDDEMCFAVGFFYPDDETAPLAPVENCFGRGDGLVCPFN